MVVLYLAGSLIVWPAAQVQAIPGKIRIHNIFNIKWKHIEKL